ncbi:serine O-acetyltransferase [Halieaceae bacterium IMCC14734]|uniref:Serine O-acetyltransferase n=1 Tax=Candidatus Litorirhabdus singularis TaxID=2518993 RepID=A0ABT3THG1_9GAMM|nr:hypothetical protein [Candidatus Litorirhabdus singularis]MCX2980822.1 serine O-acetyltransferase [Candidatus Litorirhabdus singularis]
MILIYRLGHYLTVSGSVFRFLNQPLKYLMQVLSGCHIDFSAEIGQRLHLAHPSGVIIGKGVRIGDDVVLYQHVTLGGRSKLNPEYPVVANAATLYANCVVLGAVSIGEQATVGACCLVLENIPANATVYGTPGKIA